MPGLARPESSAAPADAWQVSPPRHEIRARRVEWVAREVPTRPAGAGPPVFVVEVKGPTAAVHPALAALIGRHARKRPVSKYALCLEYARGGAT
jgi:hypothetical protein